MLKSIVKMLCSALIVASSIQLAAAADHHRVHKTGRKPAVVNEQLRNSYNQQLRNSSADSVCGLFPGPCQ